jgi:predicted transcriptional regulator
MATNPLKKACGVRASITFEPEHYTKIQEVAREKRVSVAWVVRDAIVQYLDATTNHAGADQHGVQKDKK